MAFSSPSKLTLLATLAAACAALGYWDSSTPPTKGPVATVSQKGRMFSIGSASLQVGESIRIVNDDADLQHHANVESNIFKFDSGDQEPGSKTDITFPVAGIFTVQCGIHPKMKLVVTVK